jgi:Nucleoside 2-deoxyribosyltransferase like
MAIEVQPPTDFTKYLNHNYITLFAGGSIEMNKAKPWQKQFINAFKDHDDVVILNPRREAWDSSWKQEVSDPNFREQVEWELKGLEKCDTALIYFDPETKSPISLLELGLFGASPEHREARTKMHVVCPPGFWRKGNVDIVCLRYDIPFYNDLPEACTAIKSELEMYRRYR